MAPEPFEPDHPRYHHAGCCDAHVAVATRVVVILSFISLGFRMFLQSHPSSCGWAQTVCVSNLESVLFEVLCVVLLHGAVSKEHGPMVFPFVVSQILNIIHIIKTSFFEITERPLSFDERIAAIKSGRYDLVDMRNPKRTLLITSFGRFVWIGVIFYFIFIVLNYYLFLKRRSEAYQAHATRSSLPTTAPAINASQTILDYQLSQAPRYPAQVQVVPQYEPMYCQINPSSIMTRHPPPQDQSQIPAVPPYQAMPHDHMFEPPPPYQP